MATCTTMTPETMCDNEPAGAAQPTRVHNGRWVFPVLLLCTGSALTLWVHAQLEPGWSRNDGWVWLFIIAVLSAWPGFLGWRSAARLRKDLERLQDETQGITSYRDGYADGYLACAALLRPGAGQASNHNPS